MEFTMLLVKLVSIGHKLLLAQTLCVIYEHFEAVVWSDRVETDCDYANYSLPIFFVINVQESTENGSSERMEHKYYRFISSIFQPFMQTLSLPLHTCIRYPRHGLFSSKGRLKSLGIHNHYFTFYPNSFKLCRYRG